jgi:hypothetical protein
VQWQASLLCCQPVDSIDADRRVHGAWRYMTVGNAKVAVHCSSKHCLLCCQPVGSTYADIRVHGACYTTVSISRGPCTAALQTSLLMVPVQQVKHTAAPLGCNLVQPLTETADNPFIA